MDELSTLMKRFPAVELSYETHHMKDSTSYDVIVAIPYGKKAFLWCTFGIDNVDTWFLLELGRDKRVIKATPRATAIKPWSFGTLFYGVVVNDTEFVTEDILQCRGILTHKLTFSEKLAFFRECLHDNALTAPTTSKCVQNRVDRKEGDLVQNGRFTGAIPSGDGAPSKFVQIKLPWMNDCKGGADAGFPATLPYVVHHMQYRSLNHILPYINVFPENMKIGELAQDQATSTFACTSAAVYVEEKGPRCDFKKPQYKKPTVFEVKADVQFDIYRLYVVDGVVGNRYYGLAYIPNYKTSVMMNGIFRNIKENRNLDALEESDDEEDFQDCRSNKYVDLEKRVKMECIFNAKFKRWVPNSVVKSSGIVHMTKL